MSQVPGYEGSVGPFPSEYGRPHVYARSVHSGAGNCVCGRSLPDRLHTEAAPGVPIPRDGETPQVPPWQRMPAGSGVDQAAQHRRP